MGSLIKNVSKPVRALRGRVNGLGYSPDERLMPYLELAGFGLLGVSLNDAKSKFTGLRFSWLKANFEHLSINATEHEVMCTARAYIMHIIGGVLMPNANNNMSWALYRMPFFASVRHQAHMKLLSRYLEVIHCPDISFDY
ncbi:hypothetical protein J1N35_043183 [Gossypium stocksii]|uniref:Aminotransferase-like plant mobile domain-containing protein n=1 Tax=Gossypium stocksii TaxID=47602 RepID=A0A9D3ZER9_9ROSI|nr:hypothetical protein J1N35_043183 [Gossypium stocksii]